MTDDRHIPEEDLALYAMQSLAGEESAAVRLHLSECADCRDELAAITGDLALVAAGVEQHFVTARGFLAHGDIIRDQTAAMLEAPAIPHASLTFSRDKGKEALRLGATHAIDDNGGNYMVLSEVGDDA